MGRDSSAVRVCVSGVRESYNGVCVCVCVSGVCVSGVCVCVCVCVREREL